MTLRESVRICSHSSLFNELYKEYYKNQSEDNLINYSILYREVCGELLNKIENPNSDLKLYITEKDEEDFSNLVPDERGLLTYPIPDGYFKTENIPGKMPIDEETKRLKEKDLDELKRRWVRMRELREYESERLTGFSEKAEILNGRFAMFFLVTGLLTELWTGETVPDQIATMGRTLGFIGLG